MTTVSPSATTQKTVFIASSAPLVFPTSPCSASPVIQVNLPGSLHAILLLVSYSFHLELPSSTAPSHSFNPHFFPPHVTSSFVLKPRINNIHDKQIINHQKNPTKFCVACFQHLQTTLWRLCCFQSHLEASSPSGDCLLPFQYSLGTCRHASSSSLGSCA